MTFLRNCWYVALWSEALRAGAIEARTILGEPVVLYRTEVGEAVALQDICPHRFAPLSKGRLLAGGGIACNYHGLEFGGDGRCTRNPHGKGYIPGKMRVQRYTVVEKDSLVWIWMGDREPDPALIPDFDFLDPANGFVVTRREVLRMQCDYRLIIDNLLDLSHIAFLHDGILGNAATAAAEISTQVSDTRVAVTRVSRNIPVPELFAMLLNDGSQRGDLWNTIRWDLASNLKNDALICAPGADPLDGAGIFGAHLLTPETPTSTLYHIAAARQKTRRPIEASDERVRVRLAELRRFAFEMQDQPMIIAQALNMRNHPQATRAPILLDIDAAPARAQAILKRRIEEEGGA